MFEIVFYLTFLVFGILISARDISSYEWRPNIGDEEKPHKWTAEDEYLLQEDFYLEGELSEEEWDEFRKEFFAENPEFRREDESKTERTPFPPYWQVPWEPSPDPRKGE